MKPFERMKKIIFIFLLFFITLINAKRMFENGSIDGLSKKFQYLKDYCVGKNLDFFDICSRENLSLMKESMDKEHLDAKMKQMAAKKNRLKEEKYRHKLREHFLDRHL